MTDHLSIEEIRKLDSERTQGDWFITSRNRWIKTTCDVSGYDVIFKKQNIIATKNRSGADAAFIVATPQIVKQYVTLYEEHERHLDASSNALFNAGRRLGEAIMENERLRDALDGKNDR